MRWHPATCLLAVVFCLPTAARAGDDYAAMLAFLTHSRIDGQALSGAQGSIKVNQAAGDLNTQLNAHALASGQVAQADVHATAVSHDNRIDANAPMHARAELAGGALANASGLASVNQASGQGNGQVNAVGVVAAEQPIPMQAPAPAAQRLPGRPAAALGQRHAVVAADALRGFAGVLQLNQIAGSSNVVENRLGLHVQTGP